MNILDWNKNYMDVAKWTKNLVISTSIALAVRAIPFFIISLKLFRLLADFSSFGKQFQIWGPMVLRLHKRNKCNFWNEFQAGNGMKPVGCYPRYPISEQILYRNRLPGHSTQPQPVQNRFPHKRSLRPAELKKLRFERETARRQGDSE